MSIEKYQQIKVSNPFSSTRDYFLSITGDAVEKGIYTVDFHRMIETLVKELDKVGCFVWEFNIDHIAPHREVCKCCDRTTTKGNKIKISLRVENGIGNEAAWTVFKEQGWDITCVWRDGEKEKDIWFYFKKVMY